jgi:hypothetical protein
MVVQAVLAVVAVEPLQQVAQEETAEMAASFFITKNN